MKLRHRRPITLLEILMVVAILAMASGVVAINIRNAIWEQKYQGEVQLVVDQLRLAQDLMLIANADVKVTFESRENGIEMQVLCDSKLPDAWERLIQRSVKLTQIHGIHLETEFEKGVLTLSFKSRGSIMTRGVLRLVAGTNTRYIPLEGYPKPIKATAIKPELVETNLQELVQMTIEELNEKKTPNHSS